MPSSLYAILELDWGKAIVMRPLGEDGYEFKLMEGKKALTKGIQILRDEIPSVTRWGVNFKRGIVELPYAAGSQEFLVRGKLWEKVRGADWGQLQMMADAIRRGEESFDPEIYRRNRVRMMRVGGAEETTIREVKG